MTIGTRRSLTRNCSTDHRLLVADPGIRFGFEEPTSVHPALGFFKHRASVGLRDDSFTDAEASHVNAFTEALRDFVDEVVLVTLRRKIDIALRPHQSTDIALDVR